ncbi:DUF3631 domain-containing protein [Bosea sp. NBC_00550]|uniref:DUF3631 domain-containing protein n=1 Tax=Bosea sp. NBC_00550 TaxID=2969621 RepID=UPI00222FA225|nr:DUF3631 domain-containing protein [Bosea sp. NBC_00550]UZF90648.1 DUF3631 domain-containing protein [Bosea sp. NBC_00550]
MSTKKRKSSPPPGLSAAEVVLLDTQLPEIGGAVREKPVKPDGNGWRLAIRSQVKGSGKSTLLECIDNLTPNPIIAGSITASSLFRVIDGMHPTLLIDEADNVVNKNGNPDLLAILNSGHRRAGAYVIRSVPTDNGGWVVHQFKTFAGIAMAGLKILPETLQDRSIAIPLHKATQGEKREHLVNGQSPTLVDCRRKIARWAADLPELPAVAMPPELFNRIGDNWRNLFVVAEAAGGQWTDLVRQAASEALGEEDNGLALQLLDAIWQVFSEKKVRRIHTEALLQALLQTDESPWEEANNGRAITAYWLRDELAGFLFRPDNPEEAAALRRGRQWREGNGKSRRGYTEEHLREAWRRYLGRDAPSASSSQRGEGSEKPEPSDASAASAESEAASDAHDAADGQAASAASPPHGAASAQCGAAEVADVPQRSGYVAGGSKASNIAQDIDNNHVSGEVADVAGENGFRVPPPGEGLGSAGIGPGPARRRTRPNGAPPQVGE